MFELTGTLKDLSIDYETGNPKVTIEVPDKSTAITMYEELKELKNLSFSVNKQPPPRSNSANAYFWVLCGKLAAKTRQRKIDIYKEFIRNIGDNFDIFAIKNEAVEDFIASWGNGHLGWCCDILGKSDIPNHTDIAAYYGSSTYNGSQMSALIDAAVFECQEQGIETLATEKINKLKSKWEPVNVSSKSE